VIKLKILWAVFCEEEIDSIVWNRFGNVFQASVPENDEARCSQDSPQPIGRMYRAVEAERNITIYKKKINTVKMLVLLFPLEI